MQMCRHLADIKDVIRGCKAGLPTHMGFRLRFGAAKLVHTWLPTRQWDAGENICDTQSNKRRKKTMGFPRNSVSECSRCTGAYWGLHSEPPSLSPFCLHTAERRGLAHRRIHFQKATNRNTRTHTALPCGWGEVLTTLGLTVNVLRRQSVSSLPFPDLWVDPE